MSRFPSQEMDRFNVRLPSGMREAIAERAKANGRSMNSEIVQILQEALDTDKAISESDLVDFDSTQAAFNATSTPEEKEIFLTTLAKKIRSRRKSCAKVKSTPGDLQQYLVDAWDIWMTKSKTHN